MIHASGQTVAHAEQPTQLSGVSMYEKFNPFEFASVDSAKTVYGQATTHRSHPLQRSVFTTTAPLNFAIFVFCLYCLQYFYNSLNIYQDQYLFSFLK